MRIVGLCSTWREGRLALSAVRSLRAACDVVHVYDGPIGSSPPVGPPSDWNAFRNDPRVVVRHGEWESDAAKRTSMLGPTRRLDTPVWGVILDGDELLLHGDLLPDMIEWAEADAGMRDEQSVTFPLRLVEVNASVALVHYRVIRLDLVERWVASSNQVEFANGIVRAAPNEVLLRGTEPEKDDLVGAYQRRRPLQGEPHILHRSGLRSPERQAQRQHVAEAGEWDKLVAEAGLTELPDRPEDGVRIWLPQ